MLWYLQIVDASFKDAFLPAGEPDQAVIAAYVAQKGQHPPAREGVKRWYYLLRDNPRISLRTVGMPLSDWREDATVMVGAHEIIGEFSGNRPFIGMTGLRLTMEPSSWRKGTRDQEFADGTLLLSAISEQVLDRRQIEHIQQQIASKYRHVPGGRRRGGARP